MRCSLNLHLRSVHEKPQQPNRFDSPTDPGHGQLRLEETSLGTVDLAASASSLA